MQQCLSARQGAMAYLEKNTQRLEAKVQTLEARLQEAKKRKEERAKFEKENKRRRWWMSLPFEERKRKLRASQRENIVLRVESEALKIEVKALEARKKARIAHVARWDGMFGWYREARLRLGIYKMLENLGMRY